MAQQKPLFLAAFGAFQNSSYFCPFSGSNNTGNIVPGNTAHLCKITIDTTPPPALETISIAVKTKLFTFGKAA